MKKIDLNFHQRTKMQTTTEQDICSLLKGIAISCIRKRNFGNDEVKEISGKTLTDICDSTFTSMVSWFKILNNLGYDVCIHVKGSGDDKCEGIFTVKIDDQEF